MQTSLWRSIREDAALPLDVNHEQPAAVPLPGPAGPHAVFPVNVVGQSRAMRRVIEQICQVAATDATVLLLGDTGTGKELLATQIHQRSGRRARPMVRVNCAAIPGTLIE